MVLSLLIMNRVVPQLVDGGMGQVASAGAALAPVVIPGALTTNRHLQTNTVVLRICAQMTLFTTRWASARVVPAPGPSVLVTAKHWANTLVFWHAPLSILFAITSAHGRCRAYLLRTALGAGSLVLGSISLLGTEPSRIRCSPVHERKVASAAAFRMQAWTTNMVPQRSRSQTLRIYITEVDQCR